MYGIINEWHNNFIVKSATLKLKIMSHHFRLLSPWPQVKERLKENDLTLTDDDLEYEPGRESELLERLAKKTNKSTEDVRMYIESVSANEDKAG